MSEAAHRLDPREEQFRVPSPHPGLSLFLRYRAPCAATPPPGRVVLYVHGGTFPSALSIAHRFDGRSWRDELCAAGFHVWALDFHGFGLSDPYPQMAEPATAHPPLGCAADAAVQLDRAVDFICARQQVPRLSLIAHSWGTIVAGRLAGARPDAVDRLVFFGPIARRPKKGEPQRLPAWRLISLADQWDRFTADVPHGAEPVLLRRHFDEWGERYLDTDRRSRERKPAAVQVPSGPFQDIYDAWAGVLAYDPALVRAPVAILRGEWDGMCGDADALWLFDALSRSPNRRDVKIARATHLMHLETGRYALYRETEAFLAGRDLPPGAE
ncbi:MAG TPA: alpha/beta hydrolase [Stellaceae bacterium]|nr:alpha/beta hydrolase [Stellaceae bacterium]